MSGAGPESVPTSADPRSHRPTKRRALTPSTSQAASLTHLFTHPTTEIRTDRPTPRRGPLPPDIVTNVQGSSAGAGSGEFHVYKAARRRERERLRVMDEESRAEKEAEEFERERRERGERDEGRTRKNRERREKMRARKAKGKKGGGAKAEGGEAGADVKMGEAAGAGGDAPVVEGAQPAAEDGDAEGGVEAEGLIIHEED